jgi:hypothetical protein
VGGENTASGVETVDVLTATAAKAQRTASSASADPSKVIRHVPSPRRAARVSMVVRLVATAAAVAAVVRFVGQAPRLELGSGECLDDSPGFARDHGHIGVAARCRSVTQAVIGAPGRPPVHRAERTLIPRIAQKVSAARIGFCVLSDGETRATRPTMCEPVVNGRATIVCSPTSSRRATTRSNG